MKISNHQSQHINFLRSFSIFFVEKAIKASQSEDRLYVPGVKKNIDRLMEKMLDPDIPP